MTLRNEQALLKHLVSRYDQIEKLLRRLEDGNLDSTEEEKTRRDIRRKINEIGRKLKQAACRAPLFEMIDKYALNKFQVVIMLALLRRRLSSENPFLSGRDLLRIPFDESFDLLKGIPYISETSVLISSGIINPDPTAKPADDALDSRFRLTERVYNIIVGMFTSDHGLAPIRLKKETTAYRNNLSYLVDLRKQSLLFRKRATKIFNMDYWDEIGVGVAESVSAINRQVQALRENIKKKLVKTANKTMLHTIMFSESYSLGEDELVILVTLFFQELTEGSAYVNAVDLLKLISQNEEELVRKRRFFSKRNTLIKNQLIVLEDTVNGKELTGEVFMPNWAIDLMLTGRTTGDGAIDTDARLDFHNYLKNLDSSEDFFDNLDT